MSKNKETNNKKKETENPQAQLSLLEEQPQLLSAIVSNSQTPLYDEPRSVQSLTHTPIRRSKLQALDNFEMEIESQTFQSQPSPIPSPTFGDVTPTCDHGDVSKQDSLFSNDLGQNFSKSNTEENDEIPAPQTSPVDEVPVQDFSFKMDEEQFDTYNYIENEHPIKTPSLHLSHLSNYLEKRKKQTASEHSLARYFHTTAKVFTTGVHTKLLARFRATRTAKIVPEKQYELGDMKVLSNRIKDYYVNSEADKKALYQFISISMNFEDVYFMVGGMVAFTYFRKMPEPQELNDADFIQYFEKTIKKVFNPKTKNLAAIFSYIMVEINPITLVFHDIAAALDYGSERITLWLRHKTQWNLTDARKKLSQIQELTDNFKATVGLFGSGKNVSFANVSFSVLTPSSFASKILKTPNSDFFELNSFRGYLWGDSWTSPLSDLSKSSLLMVYIICCNSQTTDIAKLFKDTTEREQIPNYPTLLENCFFNIDNISFEDQNTKSYKTWLEDYVSSLKSKMRKSHLLKYVNKFDRIYKRIFEIARSSKTCTKACTNLHYQVFIAFVKSVMDTKFLDKEEPFYSWKNNEAFKRGFNIYLGKISLTNNSYATLLRERFEKIETRNDLKQAYKQTVSEYLSIAHIETPHKKLKNFIGILEANYRINEDGVWQGLLPSKERIELLEESHFLLQISKLNDTGNSDCLTLNTIDSRFVEADPVNFANYLILVNESKVKNDINNFMATNNFKNRLENPSFDTDEYGLESFGAALSRMLDTAYEKTTGFIISGQSNSGKTFFCNKLKIIMQPLWPVESCQLNSALNRFSSPALRGMIIHEEFKANKVNLFTNFQFAETNVTEMYAKTNRPRVKFTLDVYVMDLRRPTWEVLVKCSFGSKNGDPNKNPNYQSKIKQVQNRLSIIDTRSEDFEMWMNLTRKLNLFYRNSLQAFINKQSDKKNWSSNYKKIQENFKIFSGFEVKMWSGLLGVNVVSGQPSSWDVVSEFMCYYPWFLFFREFIEHAGKWEHVEKDQFSDSDLGALDDLF